MIFKCVLIKKIGRLVLVLPTKNQLNCLTPENEEEDPTPKFLLSEAEKAFMYYKENGYVVFKSLLSSLQCQELMYCWQKEVKSYRGYIYRQASAKAEKNIFNDKGFVMNPILNLQSLNPKNFGSLRSNFEKSIVSNSQLSKATESLLGEKPRIVQSMYFEGNSATWEHQDSYYLDDEVPGKMTAAWIALEDIAIDAGRFFVCPKSHLYDYSDMNIENNIATNHEGYILSIVNLIKEKNFDIRAPRLSQGDVLFWNSMTIHGSLDTIHSSMSRSSITFHAIRTSSKFNVFRNSLRDLGSSGSNFFDVFRPKDQLSKRNKFILMIESRFPKPFYALKNLAISYLLTRKR